MQRCLSRGLYSTEVVSWTGMSLTGNCKGRRRRGQPRFNLYISERILYTSNRHGERVNFFLLAWSPGTLEPINEL